jgi:hypothetical protein
VSTIFEVPAPDKDAHADAFLKDFLLNKRWVPHGGEGSDDGDDAAGQDSADELERVEQFEAQYNFRFEEPGGATLVAQVRIGRGGGIEGASSCCHRLTDTRLHMAAPPAGGPHPQA